MNLTLKELISSFTKSIDLYNYLLKNHHRRTAVAAYHIGKQMNLDENSLSDLVIAAAMHDIGALSVTERDQLIQMDIENPYPHSSLGSYMLESFDPFLKISQIIYYHHWRYDNPHWVPEKGPVPIEAFILHVADRIDVLLKSNLPVVIQRNSIIERIQSYNGNLFHPDVVDAFVVVAQKDSFWLDIDNLNMEQIMELGISHRYEIEMTMDMLDDFAFALSKIIDSRSIFAISHSFGVSQVAYTIAKLLGYTEEKCRKIKVAGLLHDMGKIAVPTELIEKKGELSEVERADVRTHAYFTSLILSHIVGLEDIILWAAGHHENHDGSGYPLNLDLSDISEEMDVVAYADIYTALSEDRPYRRGMSSEVILKLLHNEFLEKHGTKIYSIIKENVEFIDHICKNSVEEGKDRFRVYQENAKKLEQELCQS